MTRIVMAAVYCDTSGLGVCQLQPASFLLDRVYVKRGYDHILPHPFQVITH